MTTVVTQLRNTMESARKWRVEPTGAVTQTNVQKALEQIGTLANPTVDQLITSGSTVTVGVSDRIIVINKAVASATTINLPSVSARIPLDANLEIYDWAGTAGDMTFTPSAGQTVEGLATWTVGSGGVAGSGGSLKLIPNVALNGWLVR